ncbi:hypothetical protein C1H46_032889 [Malus baccata]|uniref:Uncharacterized protein n=1 Tax=Malus baccata TaxID=106549 RepID=A0A540L500_MALBA|nr:hypothetical protein C1H46_032889 [Malus baccata]
MGGSGRMCEYGRLWGLGKKRIWRIGERRGPVSMMVVGRAVRAGKEEGSKDETKRRGRLGVLWWSKKFAFFPWMKQIGMIRDGNEKVTENGEERLNCSCCGLSMNKFYPSCIVIKPSWEVLDYAQK